MRPSFDLDIASLARLAILIHGAYGCGKTHLQGDFLRWAREQGPIAFVNVKGEDGYSSLAGMGLGTVGQTAETVEEYEEILGDLRGKKIVGLAVDSLPAFYRLMLVRHVGEPRYPDPKKDGERAKMLWGQISLGMTNAVQQSRYAAPYVLWVAPYDRSQDAVGGGGMAITPDLPGKLAHGCAGWYDLVGYLTAETLGPGRVQRKVSFAPTSAILTRQRAPRMLSSDIPIPEGGGGWVAIYNALQKAFEKKGTS